MVFRTRQRVPAIALALLGLLGSPAGAQSDHGLRREAASTSRTGHPVETPSLNAIVRGSPIQVDGRLDEAAWSGAPTASGFRQQRPTDGAAASQQTEVRILFDDGALYIGARMYDSLGAAGVRSQLARRDQEAESDWIEFIFDTYHDHVGRTIFAVNPSGVKRDAGQATSSADPSWDPVWQAGSAIDSLGWTAEIRIPFSQLRFAREERVWGMQIWRTVNRLNEISMWAYWGVEESGGPSRFGHLEGVEAGGQEKRAELLPYVVLQHDRLRPGNTDDPFFDPRSAGARFGGDVKYRVSSSLTLNATINPDFGQVEVDPAEVNLSAFETFFSERRPFFVEGNGIFQFGSFNCYFCSNASSLSLFYSRRIGRQPQGALPGGTDYADVPDATAIIGAAKLTGRSRSGWSLGFLEAVTARESARLQTGGVPGAQEVEPLTNYFVGRARRDLNNGNLNLGVIGTSVIRQLDDPLLKSRLSAHAEAVGLDWRWTWKDRRYSLMGSMAASNVSGDPAAMDRLQRSSARYFQRPDRQGGGNGVFSNRYDPGASRLGGYGAYARLAKEAGSWLWESSVNLRSPGFETNDLAFLTRADYLAVNGNILRQFNTPTSWYRSMMFIVGAQQVINFDGDVIDRDYHGFMNLEFLNYWSVGGFVIRRPEVLDDRTLRGGPVVGRPSFSYTSMFVNSDRRKMLSANAEFSTGVNAAGARGYDASLGLNLRPSSNMQFSLGPSYNRGASSQQYVTAVEAPGLTDFYGRRYVVADLKQDNLSLNARANITFTPTLTLEVFAQPFVSSVSYTRFKEFEAPRTVRTRVYGEEIGTIAPVVNSAGMTTDYDVDPDGTGQSSFRLANPDFNYRSIRGNVVLRWEYRPGSTLFLVWAQDRDAFQQYSHGLSIAEEWGAFGKTQPNNYFLIKFNYWLNL